MEYQYVQQLQMQQLNQVEVQLQQVQMQIMQQQQYDMQQFEMQRQQQMQIEYYEQQRQMQEMQMQQQQQQQQMAMQMQQQQFAQQQQLALPGFQEDVYEDYAEEDYGDSGVYPPPGGYAQPPPGTSPDAVGMITSTDPYGRTIQYAVDAYGRPCSAPMLSSDAGAGGSQSGYVSPDGQVYSGQQQSSPFSVDPVTGQVIIDPVTGQPVQQQAGGQIVTVVDPNTGQLIQAQQVNPNTGQLVQRDGSVSPPGLGGIPDVAQRQIEAQNAFSQVNFGSELPVPGTGQAQASSPGSVQGTTQQPLSSQQLQLANTSAIQQQQQQLQKQQKLLQKQKLQLAQTLLQKRLHDQSLQNQLTKLNQDLQGKSSPFIDQNKVKAKTEKQAKAEAKLLKTQNLIQALLAKSQASGVGNSAATLAAQARTTGSGIGSSNSSNTNSASSSKSRSGTAQGSQGSMSTNVATATNFSVATAAGGEETKYDILREFFQAAKDRQAASGGGGGGSAASLSSPGVGLRPSSGISISVSSSPDKNSLRDAGAGGRKK
jgi:hypothetical protein